MSINPICIISGATPESGIQKAVIITPSKLQLINADITDDYVDLLIPAKITDLVFEDCSMPEKVSELFVTSKESVLFKNCIRTNPKQGDAIKDADEAMDTFFIDTLSDES